MPGEAVDRALLVDDASSDQTTAVALQHGFDVITHPRNRGYGANQKTCYSRSVLDGADVVVMVHADNQYDPALVREMVEPIERGEADVVIGSRLLEDETIAGGMPRWKWLGNRALTWVENRAVRRRASAALLGPRRIEPEHNDPGGWMEHGDRVRVAGGPPCLAGGDGRERAEELGWRDHEVAVAPGRQLPPPFGAGGDRPERAVRPAPAHVL